MSIERTRETLTAYLQTLIQRGPYDRYFADGVTFILMGTDQEVRGRAAVEQFIRYLHEVAFDAQPEVTTMIVDDGRAGIEALFIGTHIGEFAGIAASNKNVRVPYAVIYDIVEDKITALRAYMPVDVLMQQIGSAASTSQAGA